MATPKTYSTTFNTFTLLERLGEGGAGTVFRAVDESGSQFALKLLDSHKATTQKKKRFQNEIRFCQTTRHPNVVPIVDIGITPDGSPFYVMPVYDSTMTKLMEGLPAEKVLPYFDQILSGVEAAHNQGVCHRDLKPENILYDLKKNTLVVGDFGVAGFKEEDLYTAVETRNERIGNFLYSAPEQRVRGKEVTHLADVYSLGLLLNEMFTAEVPQGTGYKKIGEIAPRYSYLDDLVDQMISQNPSARPQEIQTIKIELNARGNEFVRLQELDRLKQQTVPSIEVDGLVDPIIIKEVSGYRDRHLEVELSAMPSPDWMRQFRNLGNYAFIIGSSPQDIQFHASKAFIEVDEHSAKQALLHFRGYVQAANAQYEAWVRKQAQIRQENIIKERRAAIEEREREKRVLKLLM